MLLYQQHNMEYIINPLSLRPIQVDGRLYKDLVKRGIIESNKPKICLGLTKETQQTRLDNSQDIVTQTKETQQTQLTRSVGNPESEFARSAALTSRFLVQRPKSLDDELVELDKILDEFASDESDALML
jgi:hypothetical protein